jgi:hypothetical protein
MGSTTSVERHFDISNDELIKQLIASHHHLNSLENYSVLFTKLDFDWANEESYYSTSHVTFSADKLEHNHLFCHILDYFSGIVTFHELKHVNLMHNGNKHDENRELFSFQSDSGDSKTCQETVNSTPRNQYFSKKNSSTSVYDAQDSYHEVDGHSLVKIMELLFHNKQNDEVTMHQCQTMFRFVLHAFVISFGYHHSCYESMSTIECSTHPGSGMDISFDIFIALARAASIRGLFYSGDHIFHSMFSPSFSTQTSMTSLSKWTAC